MSAPATVVVACLAGHGIGPEVTAAASRALAQVSRQHGFRVDEVHPPFDGEAVMSSGHPLPSATRSAALAADAVLVAGATAPALAGVRAELDLGARVTRTLDGTGEATTFAPLHLAAESWTIERAFRTARARTGRLVSVGVNGTWRARVDAVARQHDGIEVEHRTLAESLGLLARGSAGVLVAEHVLGDAISEAPQLGGRRRLTATGDLSISGPGLFAPTHGTAHEDAGQGMADPSEMLLATALLLTEGLGRRAAGEALEVSLALALARPHRSTGTGVVATTRELVDAVLGLLPSARRDTEFALSGTR